jgi:hypothetical protein
MVTHPSPRTGFVRERQRELRTHADQQRLDGMRQRIGFLRVADPAAPGARAVITRDRAIYESLRLSEAEADFNRRYPEFDSDGPWRSCGVWNTPAWMKAARSTWTTPAAACTR